MQDATQSAGTLVPQEYRWGFVTALEADSAPKGLNEDTIRLISAKKGEPQFMLDWRLAAYAHWRTLREPHWASVRYGPIDYQDIVYYSAPKTGSRAKSLAEVDPELLRTYEKLGIPLREQEQSGGVAVDAVFDSVSVATTFKEKLAERGIIFCSFSEAVREHPGLVRQYLGSVVPPGDNFFAALNAAVFSDGTFVYVPKGVRCPMELSTYFRINAAHRPVRAHPDRRRRRRLRQLPRRLHRAQARREPTARRGGRAGCPGRGHHQVFHRAELVSGRQGGQGRHLQLRHQARRVPRRQFEDFLDPGGDRLGDHLEISQLVLRGDKSVGEFYSVALTNNAQQADTGTKMIHIGRNTTSTIISKGIAAGHGRTPTAVWSRCSSRRRQPATTPSATRC